MTKTDTAHIWLDDEGRAWIDDSNIKVIEVALDRIAWGWSAEEIHFQHYGYLALAQIHAALSYYYDHQAAIDGDIEGLIQEAERLRVGAGPSKAEQRLRERGLLP